VLSKQPRINRLKVQGPGSREVHYIMPHRGQGNAYIARERIRKRRADDNDLHVRWNFHTRIPGLVPFYTIGGERECECGRVADGRWSCS
jgi:hypothetical protein